MIANRSISYDFEIKPIYFIGENITYQCVTGFEAGERNLTNICAANTKPGSSTVNVEERNDASTCLSSK